MIEKEQKWFEKIGYGSASEACKSLQLTRWQLTSKLEEFEYDVKRVIDWRDENKKYEEHVKRLMNQSGCSNRDRIVSFIKKGYSDEIIVTSILNGVTPGFFEDSYFYNNEYITLNSFCGKYNYTYSYLVKLKNKMGDEQFRKYLESGLLIKEVSKSDRSDGLEVDSVFYSYDDIASLLGVARSSIATMKCKNRENLESRIRSRLIEKSSKEDIVVLPNGLEVTIKDLAELYDIKLWKLKEKFRKYNSLILLLYKLEQGRFRSSKYYNYNNRQITLKVVADETGINLNTLSSSLGKYSYIEVFDAAYRGHTISQEKNNYFLNDGTMLTSVELAKLYNVSLSTIHYNLKLHGKKWIEDKLNDGTFAECVGFKEVLILLDNVFYTIKEVAVICNLSRQTVQRHQRDTEYFLKDCHFRERLQFKDNSPYTTWFCEDTWEYQCPVCQRKLLLTTEELKTYKHDDKLCAEYEIE